MSHRSMGVAVCCRNQMSLQQFTIFSVVSPCFFCCAVEVDEDSPSPKREVLRLVREDEADDLLDKVVYIQWTENDEFHGDWFRARIKKVSPLSPGHISFMLLLHASLVWQECGRNEWHMMFYSI